MLAPGDLEYERAVACSNLLYRFTRPKYVVRPQNTGQVQTIVQEAVARELPLTIKNGGHSYIGSSFPNEGIMLDLKDMNKVAYDRYVSDFWYLSRLVAPMICFWIGTDWARFQISFPFSF